MEKKHVHETNPKRTFITVIIFIAIIVVGLLTVRSPKLKYTLSPQQTVEMVLQDDNVMYPYELEDIFAGTIDTIILIDIRDRFEFGQGHIPGAENISAVTLINQENMKRLKELEEGGMTVVIYGDHQLEANGPWMVLRQLGFTNIKILLGGYEFYNQWADMLGDTYYEDAYLLGAPRFNYAEVAAAAVNNQGDESSEAQKPVTVVRKKKGSVAEGGC